MKLKRDSKGRFLKGTEPPLKGRKMPSWWKEKDSLGKIRSYAEGPSIKKRISRSMSRYFGKKGSRERAKRIRMEFLKKNPGFSAVLRAAALKQMKENPGNFARLQHGSKKYWKDEKRRKQRSLEMKRFWTPEKREEQSVLKKRQYAENPKLRKKIDAIVTDWWKSHPEERKKRADRVKRFFIENPDALKEFMKHGKNPLKRHIKTKQGFLVRSNGELQIANFLFGKRIPCLYESIDLMITESPFKGNICNPDFYVPEWNIFVEFYGGYPSAWKKKVLKNKIYRSHKIPVLGITPAELRDLDYHLLKDGRKLSQSTVAKNFRIKEWLKKINA